MKKRKYADGVPQHVYCRVINGKVIFYNLMDFLVFVTLYYCLAHKYHIRTNAFCIMPNHYHSQQSAECESDFSAFNMELESRFAVEYNRWHNRSGQLFETFGSVPEYVGKTIRNNIAYINNNAPVGRLSSNVLDYKWNLLECFNRKTDLTSVPKAQKKVFRKVDYCSRHFIPLSYDILSHLFSGLSGECKAILTDYILEKYNVVDFNGMLQYYGSFEKAIYAMNANCGSEPEMKEDWEDYSVYKEMLKIIVSKGFDTEHLNFETMDPDTLSSLAAELSRIPYVKTKQIRKFLHLKKPED